MRLSEFSAKYIAPNTLIRLWKKSDQEGCIHEMISDKCVMDWELERGEGELGKYGNNEFLYITDIVVTDSEHSEAINVVIKI
jgi:hypothetical protein